MAERRTLKKVQAPREIDMKRLREKMRRFAIRNGAHLFGVAPVDRFGSAPHGHHPADYLPDCQSVVVIGMRLLDRGLFHNHLLKDGADFIADENIRLVMQEYFWEIESHGPTSDILSDIGYRVASSLQDAGFGSIYFRSSNADIYGQQQLLNRIKPNFALFSHRHAAVRAGLGEFGLSNLVVTHEYGPRVRFVSVLTEAKLEPSPLLKEKSCLGFSCGLCLRHCGPVGVLTPGPAAEKEEIWINMVGTTNKSLCLEYSMQTYCKGQCQLRCPVGTRV